MILDRECLLGLDIGGVVFRFFVFCFVFWSRFDQVLSVRCSFCCKSSVFQLIIVRDKFNLLLSNDLGQDFSFARSDNTRIWRAKANRLPSKGRPFFTSDSYLCVPY